MPHRCCIKINGFHTKMSRRATIVANWATLCIFTTRQIIITKKMLRTPNRMMIVHLFYNMEHICVSVSWIPRQQNIWFSEGNMWYVQSNCSTQCPFGWKCKRNRHMLHYCWRYGEKHNKKDSYQKCLLYIQVCMQFFYRMNCKCNST